DAKHRETGRRRFQPRERQQIAVDDEIAGDEANTFVSDEQISDRGVHVVLRLVEAATAARREGDDTGKRELRSLRERQRLGRNIAALEVERVRAFPGDRCRAGALAV